MILEAIILGILQGILEWLPVSSQGQLSLAMYLFKVNENQILAFSIFLHIGTMFAAIAYFKGDIINLFKRLPSYRFNYTNQENRLISFLLLATILTGAVGYSLYRLIREAVPSVGEAFIALIGGALIVTGLIQKYVKARGERGTADLNLKDTLLLGVVQGFSIIPGISRSGITTSSLLFRKFSSEEALKLSFLMSIPAVLAAEIGLGLIEGLPPVGLEEILVGILFSFAFGLLSIHALMKIARKIRFWAFCILIGTLALLPMLAHLPKIG